MHLLVNNIHYLPQKHLYVKIKHKALKQKGKMPHISNRKIKLKVTINNKKSLCPIDKLLVRNVSCILMNQYKQRAK